MRSRALFLSSLSLAVLLGCEQASVSTEAPADTKPAVPTRAWRTIDGSAQVALPAGEVDEEMSEAMAEARRTAEDARLRWSIASASNRSRWAVKWGAPTVAGSLEYLWVEPMRWSRFRIEGRLASPPQNLLACGRALDEMVSFPVEELADWVYERPEPDPSGASRRDGAYTTRVLEKRFGR